MEDVVPVVVRLLRVSPGDDQLLPGRVDAEVHGDVALSLQESVLSVTEIKVTVITSSSIQYPDCSGFSLREGREPVVVFGTFSIGFRSPVLPLVSEVPAGWEWIVSCGPPFTC